MMYIHDCYAATTTTRGTLTISTSGSERRTLPRVGMRVGGLGRSWYRLSYKHAKQRQ